MLMKLIQMPVPDLARYIKEEVEKNPLLDESAPNITTEELPLSQEDNDDWDDEDYRYREHLEQDKNSQRHDTILTADTSLTERLLEQIEMKPLSQRQEAIAHEIVGSLDDNGYLNRDINLIINDLAFRQGIEVSANEVEAVLAIVQQCDPIGVGARSLQECLSLQLHHTVQHERAVADAIEIADHHFDLFSKHHYERIRDKMGWDAERMEQAIRLIRRLNPKPGLDISDSSDSSHYIVPDYYVSFHDGELNIAPNESHLPSLQLNSYYHDLHQNLAAASHQTAEERDTLNFLKDKEEEAQEFIDTLHQRSQTLNHIIDYIVRYQSHFFATGDPYDLKPLQQKDVAEATGYDTSTVSRVVNSKYLQTDFGTVALKDCFTKSVATDSGDSIGVEKIKRALAELVENEDKTAPLTDEALTAELRRQGFPLARRTVAKYREAMGIAVGRLRRQLKTVLLLVACGLSMTLSAQQPTYFDSLIDAQRGVLKMPDKNKKKKSKSNEPSDKTVKDKKTYTPTQQPLIRQSEATRPAGNLPVGYLWYGNNFSSHRVRERILTFDSLPDEVNIRLVKSDSDFCFPVKNIITSPYGWRWERAHRGVDIRLNVGTPVHCVFAGVVRVACPMGAYGNLVVVRHYNGLETAYAHLSKINVTPNQEVMAGDVIGLGGSTGRSTGPHLHFEVRFMYETFDPEWILDFTKYTLRTKKLHLDKSYFGVVAPRRGQAITYKADKSYITESPTPANNGMRYYTVKEDDDLTLIAIKCRTTVAKIRELNPDLKKVRKGLRLRVK